MDKFFAIFSKAFQSKTLIFGWALTIFGVAETYLTALQGVLFQAGFGKYAAGIGVIVMFLRSVTTKALTLKKSLNS